MDFIETIALFFQDIKPLRNFLVLFPEVPQVNKNYFEIQSNASGNYLRFKNELVEADIFVDREKFQEIHYHNNLRNGIYRNFDGNVIIKEGRYVNDLNVGKWIERYSNGEISNIHNYLNGKLDGETQHFYRNGQMEAEGRFANNLQEGTWNRWNVDGTPRNQLKFVNGILQN